MKPIFTGILPLILIILFSSQTILLSQNDQFSGNNATTTNSNQKINLDDSRNRFPEILHDVKVLLSEVLIADHHLDTLEVIYNLSRIYDLLMEADQIGDMNQEDQEEFERFEKSFLDIYTHKLGTIRSSDAPVTAERFRRDITEALDPLEIEMGKTKYVVVDDRDGHIPLVRNKQVDQFITYFTTAKGRKQFAIWMKRYVEYKDLILPILKKHEMPEELMVLAMIESGLNPKAYSRANASGMWQFIYSTGKNYGLKRDWYIDERRDPIKATHAACEYLKDLNEQFDNWYLALAAYNCGSGRISRASKLHQTYDFWQMHSLPRESRNYIPYYLAAAIIAKEPEKYGFTIPKVKPFSYEEVVLEHSADLAVLSRVAGIKVKTLRKYNPELRQSATPADNPYLLKLPKGKKEQFLARWNSIPESERFAPQFIVHRVRYGESLWTISKKYGASIHDIAAVNKIRNRHKIKVGNKLKVPLKGGVLRTWGTKDNGGPAGHYKVTYKVKRGDTLGQIAEDYKSKASKIRRWNGLKYGSSLIYPGQKLKIWVKEG
ncbi:MAG: transglycosylase SLT domain-containing protein [Candidatus Neomarinimicrobiota bacterium]|nr:transglycosylase SLT domain-containing protein [Candidatus Neomarinimicrobiota bacterium]